MNRKTIDVDQVLWDALRHSAKENRRTLAGELEVALIRYLKKHLAKAKDEI